YRTAVRGQRACSHERIAAETRGGFADIVADRSQSSPGHPMGNLKVYGVAGSRAYRVLWMVNELGLDYEHVPIHFRARSARSPEYLAVNPNGRIPAIDDDGLKLWESMAINLYLAKKHAKLWPSTLEGEAQALQWSFWVMTEVEEPALAALLHRMFLPEDMR